MKKLLAILAVSALAIPAMAQETNQAGPRRDKKNPPEWNEKKREQQQQRRLLLMERELKKIGVTEQEKAQITELQKNHKEKMTANTQHTARARERLSKLLDAGAPMEALEAAIQEISATQTEQLRILVRNRIEMERILGKEKNAQFMKNARKQFKKHGQRSGPGMPPRPGMPPIPGQNHGGKEPPMPDDYIRFMENARKEYFKRNQPDAGALPPPP